MLNLDELLAPVSAAQPCGEDLAFSPELDAIARARQSDDPSIDQGAWVTTLKEADWKFVAQQCGSLIARRSKDLQLAVWLVEASAKTGGLRGMADSLFVLAAVCDAFWSDMYPVLEDGIEQRIGKLCWIAARIPQLMLEFPVTEDGAFPMHSVASAGAELELARKRSTRAFYASLQSDGELCEAALARLELSIDAHLPEDGPGFTAAKDALQTVLHYVTPLARDPSAVPAAQAGAPVSSARASASASVGTGTGTGTESRAHALAQLREVADFFRRTEPHSPVAYLADKAAHWGEQPLHVWLRGVVKDDVAFAQFEDLLGLRAPA
ncbi:MAG: type VI secretion system protein TssA [Pseudomonadota bacterium]|nr:type VI secretion system protein TssA [Pseudomonadota bacterium]